ncbi:hypothetical protein EDB84DRAFT_1675808 [Lactarius hengduanensis]|nr:hypothetical protein EDB84DRAFT_1675808 [Lactarius hengduanensis]
MSACSNRRSITPLLPLPSPRQIVLESLLALFLAIIGACVKAPTLEEITSNEMKTKYRPRTIENMDTRMCFANFVTTGKLAGDVGVFAQAVSDLATSDLGKSLSYFLEALAELQRRTQEVESAQVRADQASLLSAADEYARIVNSVRVSRRVLISDICAHTDSNLLRDGFSSRVRVYCITHGDTQTRSCGASYERTNGTVFQARSQLTASDIHIVRLAEGIKKLIARHIVSMWAERWALYATQEFEQVSRLVRPVKTEVAFTGPYAKRFRLSDPPSSITCPRGSGLRNLQHLILSCPRFLHALTPRSFPSPTPASSLLPRGLHASSTSFKSRAPAPDPNKALLRWITRRVPMCHLNPTR